jgi:hypothetical protein
VAFSTGCGQSIVTFCRDIVAKRLHEQLDYIKMAGLRREQQASEAHGPHFLICEVKCGNEPPRDLEVPSITGLAQSVAIPNERERAAPRLGQNTLRCGFVATATGTAQIRHGAAQKYNAMVAFNI